MANIHQIYGKYTPNICQIYTRYVPGICQIYARYVPDMCSPVFPPDRLLLGTLEPLLPPQVAAVLKHVPGVRVQRPVASLARPVRRSGNFDETVVEGETVPDGVLPPLLVLSGD